MPKNVIFNFECIVRHTVFHSEEGEKIVLQWIGLPGDPRAACVQRYNENVATEDDAAALSDVPVFDEETVNNPPLVIL